MLSRPVIHIVYDMALISKPESRASWKQRERHPWWHCTVPSAHGLKSLAFLVRFRHKSYTMSSAAEVTRIPEGCYSCWKTTKANGFASQQRPAGCGLKRLVDNLLCIVRLTPIYTFGNPSYNFISCKRHAGRVLQ